MTAAVSVAARPATARRRGALTTAVAVAAVAFTMAIALTNQPYFDAVNRLIGADDPVARGAIYSSYLLLIGLAITPWRPGAFGLGLGDTIRRWRLVAAAVVGMAALTAVVLSVVSPTLTSRVAQLA